MSSSHKSKKHHEKKPQDEATEQAQAAVRSGLKGMDIAKVAHLRHHAHKQKERVRRFASGSDWEDPLKSASGEESSDDDPFKERERKGKGTTGDGTRKCVRNERMMDPKLNYMRHLSFEMTILEYKDIYLVFTMHFCI
jgi:hypothetical protein